MAATRPFPVVWQRLVNADGRTCDRCGSTGAALAGAMAKLGPLLAPLGLEPVLQTREIDEAAFAQAPLESNRIWLGGRPLEHWLGASVGSSPCCDACGDRPCRTVECGGTSHEAIPEEVILKAALLAAAASVSPPAASAPCGCAAAEGPCCPR